MKVWGALGEVRGALRATVGAASGLQQRSTQRSAARTRCAKSALSVPAKKKAPPSPKPQQQQKKPNLELQRSDDRKAISQLVVCEGIRVGERIKQTHQKE